MKNEVDISSLISNIYIEDILDLMADSAIVEYISDRRWEQPFIDILINTLTKEQLNLLNKKLIKYKIYGRS